MRKGVEKRKEKSKDVHRNSIIPSRILRNRLMDGMEKCLKIEKIHIFQQKMVAFATKQNIDFRLVNNTRQYVQ